MCETDRQTEHETRGAIRAGSLGAAVPGCPTTALVWSDEENPDKAVAHLKVQLSTYHETGPDGRS